MSTGEKNVIGAIAALGVWPQKKFMVQQRLGDGPTNETWLVTCEQEHYVLRLVKPFAVSVGLSLKDELHITLAAQQRNLAPEVVASCVTSGIVLSRYVQGRPWTAGDLQNKQQLVMLANTLRQLHGLDCKARLLDLRAVLQDYAQRSTDARAGTWRDSALARLDEIDPREHTVCHNDLTAANIIDNGTLCFIDWEYAAQGDPLFELAVIVTHHHLDITATEHFLSAYLGQSDDRAKADLNRWCDVYRNLLALWLSLEDVKS